MGFGKTDKYGGTKPQDKSNRTDDQNNPADNPNRKERGRNEDEILKDQGDFEPGKMDQPDEVETPGGNARTADHVGLDE